MSFLLFFLGAALGSFLNVIALRYDPDRFLLTRKTAGGRSHCDHCGARLRWFELVPLASFLIQRGRCRRCGTRLSAQYPLAELLAGLIVLFVPARLADYAFFFFPNLAPLELVGLQVVFTAAFLALLLMSLIDYRLQIIPDELSVFLGLLGLAAVTLAHASVTLTTGSFLGHYSLLFGLRDNALLNHAAGAAGGFLFLGGLFAVTRGRGIGLGDVKLSLALGLLFGWPDIILLQLFGFVLGSCYGLYQIIFGAKSLKSFLAFGPFLALGAAVLYFRGFELTQGYFQLFGLWP